MARFRLHMIRGTPLASSSSAPTAGQKHHQQQQRLPRQRPYQVQHQQYQQQQQGSTIDPHTEQDIIARKDARSTGTSKYVN
jgi:hypothetical protein